jgi:hypothetical protein
MVSAGRSAAAAAETDPPGNLIDRVLPRHDARTVQQRAVGAGPARTYEAIWQADVLGSPLARTLIAIGRLPERIAARGGDAGHGSDRHWRLAQVLEEDGPWILVGERPGSEVVLGLLWTPPAGGTTCAPPEFAAFQAPGVAKVAWSLAAVPYGRGSLLVCETRTLALDAAARRRFRLLWPLVGPFAAVARGAMMAAIARHAERSGP